MRYHRSKEVNHVRVSVVLRRRSGVGVTSIRPFLPSRLRLRIIVWSYLSFFLQPTQTFPMLVTFPRFLGFRFLLPQLGGLGQGESLDPFITLLDLERYLARTQTRWRVKGRGSGIGWRVEGRGLTDQNRSHLQK